MFYYLYLRGILFSSKEDTFDIMTKELLESEHSLIKKRNSLQQCANKIFSTTNKGSA